MPGLRLVALSPLSDPFPFSSLRFQCLLLMLVSETQLLVSQG